MNAQRFTIKSQDALQGMQQIAEENGHQEIKDLHLLSAMLKETESLVIPVLQKLEVNTTDLERKVEDALKKLPKVSGVRFILLRKFWTSYTRLKEKRTSYRTIISVWSIFF